MSKIKQNVKNTEMIYNTINKTKNEYETYKVLSELYVRLQLFVKRREVQDGFYREFQTVLLVEALGS